MEERATTRLAHVSHLRRYRILVRDDARAQHARGSEFTHGVQQGDKVVLLMGNCLEYLYVFRGGRIGVIVPVNPTLKADEIAHITNNSEAETLITVPELAPCSPSSGPSCPAWNAISSRARPPKTPSRSPP